MHMQTATSSRCPHCGKRIAAEAPRVRKPMGVTARARKRKADQDARYAAKIRAKVRKRDGYCRIAKDVPLAAPNCYGVSEWAHVGMKKRFATRGLPPEERHATADSIQACTFHHRRYDAGDFEIHKLSDKGCDGPLRYVPR